MGFFSWYTQDTSDSIANHYSNMPTFTVYMFDDKGNKWREDNYEGYGIFGGKDFFELLAEMNGLGSDREAGIALAFKDSPDGDNPDCKFPNLAKSARWEWRNDTPESCPDQGYFYPEYEDEDDYEDFYEAEPNND